MAIPDNTRRLLVLRLDTHRQQRWAELDELSICYRGDFVYLTTTSLTGEPMPLCRLTYRKNAEYWGFEIYLGSRDSYENSLLPNGMPTGAPDQALDCARGLLSPRPNRLDLTFTHELQNRTTWVIQHQPRKTMPKQAQHHPSTQRPGNSR